MTVTPHGQKSGIRELNPALPCQGLRLIRPWLLPDELIPMKQTAGYDPALFPLATGCVPGYTMPACGAKEVPVFPRPLYCFFAPFYRGVERSGVEPPSPRASTGRTDRLCYRSISGFDRRRSCNPLVNSQVLCQLSYEPII